MTKKEFENLRLPDILIKGSNFYAITGMSRIQGKYDYELTDENGNIIVLTEENFNEFGLIKGDDL